MFFRNTNVGSSSDNDKREWAINGLKGGYALAPRYTYCSTPPQITSVATFFKRLATLVSPEAVTYSAGFVARLNAETGAVGVLCDPDHEVNLEPYGLDGQHIDLGDGVEHEIQLTLDHEQFKQEYTRLRGSEPLLITDNQSGIELTGS